MFYGTGPVQASDRHGAARAVHVLYSGALMMITIAL